MLNHAGNPKDHETPHSHIKSKPTSQALTPEPHALISLAAGSIHCSAATAQHGMGKTIGHTKPLALNIPKPYTPNPIDPAL